MVIATPVETLIKSWLPPLVFEIAPIHSGCAAYRTKGESLQSMAARFLLGSPAGF